MSKFKVGDKIKPVLAKWNQQLLETYSLEPNNVYTVSDCFYLDTTYPAMNLEEIGNAIKFDMRYFELIEYAPTSNKAVQDLINKIKVKPDAVNSPKHYSVFEEVEAIEVIASSMTEDQFYGYCFGNILKYRLRAGGKDDVMQEIGKADRYQGLYTENKHLCKGEAL